MQGGRRKWKPGKAGQRSSPLLTENSQKKKTKKKKQNKKKKKKKGGGISIFPYDPSSIPISGQQLSLTTQGEKSQDSVAGDEFSKNREKEIKERRGVLTKPPACAAFLRARMETHDLADKGAYQMRERVPRGGKEARPGEEMNAEWIRLSLPASELATRKSLRGQSVTVNS